MTTTTPLSARFTTADFESEVTQVLVASDARENTRKIEEEKKRENRRTRRLNEKSESDKHNADIAGKWGAIMEKSIPEELVKEIDAQKAQCEEVIASKDKVIKEFRQEIKNKEDEYQKLLLKQGEEVDGMIEKMKRQFSEALAHHEAQLVNAEQVLEEDRRTFLNAHQSDLGTLMEKRQSMELRFMEWKQEAIEDDMRQIEQLMVMDAEEYNILKVKLETEIQTLEQQMQEMRATYQLNNEKLEYNFRLLHEREYDHTQQIQQQKKKINRLQDMLSTVRAKYAKLDKKYRQRNVELTEEYKRMTEQYKDLQTKFSHFQEYDSQKYKEVWNLSTDRMKESVQQVLKADKVIHEQLLHLVWYPPQADIFALPKRASSAKARTSSLSLTSTISPSPLPPPSSSLSSFTSFSPSIPSSALSHLGEVLALIRNEAGFLTKSGIKPDSVEDMDRGILKALGIENDEDAKKLVSLFILDDGENDEEEVNEDEESMETKERRKVKLINPAHVMDKLTLYVKMRNEARERENEDGEEVKNGTTKREKEKERERERERGGMSEDAVKEYWDRIANVIPGSAINAWDRLEAEMTKYNQILKERINLLQGNDKLREQNEELKRLLNQYLNAKINEELIVPPVSMPVSSPSQTQQRRVSSSSSSRNSTRR